MKNSKGLNIFLLVLEILVGIILVGTLAFCIAATIQVKNDIDENGWAALGLVIVILYGLIGNGAGFILSLVGLITSCVSRSNLSKGEPSEQVAYLKKKRKTDITLFIVFMVLAVIFSIAEILFMNVIN
ncbi:MAG: hypothetical protein IJW43_05505 [Clostridia bacterium]|nr:hypothetical protein [Clostridia bacterium]